MAFPLKVYLPCRFLVSYKTCVKIRNMAGGQKTETVVACLIMVFGLGGMLCFVLMDRSEVNSKTSDGAKSESALDTSRTGAQDMSLPDVPADTPEHLSHPQDNSPVAHSSQDREAMAQSHVDQGLGYKNSGRPDKALGQFRVAMSLANPGSQAYNRAFAEIQAINSQQMPTRNQGIVTGPSNREPPRPQRATPSGGLGHG